MANRLRAAVREDTSASASPVALRVVHELGQAAEQARHELFDQRALLGTADVAELAHQRVRERQVALVVRHQSLEEV